MSKELREQGYALMCTSFPMSDSILEVVEVPPTILVPLLYSALCQFCCTMSVR